MIKAAVIGVGNMGRHHARVYNDLEDVELVAVADLDETRRSEIARRYKVKTYSQFEDLLKDETIDILSIAVPTVLHHSVALQAIDRGIHILVEKPIAFTVEEAKEMIASSAEKKLILASGHIERFNPAVTELKHRLDSGELGLIFQINARRLSPFPHYVRDVGVVIDLATHELDIMRYLLDCEVQNLFAQTSRNIHERYEDMLSGILRFDNGVVGVLDINWMTPTKVRELRITGEQGVFMVDYINQDLFFYKNSEAPDRWDAMALFKGVGEGHILKLKIGRVEPLQAQLRAFVDSVATGSKGIVTGQDGLQALALAHLLLDSAKKGAPINVKEEIIRRGWTSLST